MRVYYNKRVTELSRENARHAAVKKTLKRLIHKGDRVLDLGCGTGITSGYMTDLGADVVGVDFAVELLRRAAGAKYIAADVCSFYLRRAFDVITIVDLMEHIRRDKVVDLVAAVMDHSHNGTVVYLNIPDGRFIRYMRRHHPEKLQPIDEDYSVPEVTSYFIPWFEPVWVNMYGIDCPLQYTEYLFVRPPPLWEMYETGTLCHNRG